MIATGPQDRDLFRFMTEAAMWEVVGISALEEQVYEALLPRRQATVADLVSGTGLTTRRLTTALNQLVRQGLATRLPGSPARFAPVPPDLVASELLSAQDRKRRQLQAHVQKLTHVFRSATGERHPAELIEVLEGAHNVRTAFRRLQHDAKREVRVFDRPPYFNAGGPDSYEANEDEIQSLIDDRVAYRVIYARQALEAPGRMANVWDGVREGEQARVAGSLSLKLALADDQVALVNSTNDFDVETAYLVHPSALLDALSELFEATWQRSVALNQAVESSKSAGVLGGVRQDLLGMLAAGATDETIARTFGMSVRTVQRHVHAIMNHVGADTRFQAGMEAVRRGCI
jgi:DNA-binding CsgD family transcriptional regulator